MELKLVEQKVINGLCVRTDNATEMNPDTGKIGALWQEFDNTVAVDYKGGERVYGVYFDYESDHTGKFNVLAGFDGGQFSAEWALKEIVIPAGKYLVFSHKGEMPQIAIDAWTQVWNYFANGDAQYHRLFTTDFEYYPSGNEIEVHIAVK